MSLLRHVILLSTLTSSLIGVTPSLHLVNSTRNCDDLQPSPSAELPGFGVEREQDAAEAVDHVPIRASKFDASPTVATSEVQGVRHFSPKTAKIRSSHHRARRYLHFCYNNGTFINGRCECPYPFVGAKCTEYACEHGLSVGSRYDPGSLFFNQRCICDEDWAGDLCNVPINDQCNERGQYTKGRCKCHGYYFGPSCQYVGKCVNGKLQEGKCECSYGYEGDYCDKIVCHHGYRDKSNNSDSCICPPRHTGRFCDECLLKGAHVLAYPNCTLEVVPYHARLSRQKTDSMIVMRLIILLTAMGLLLVLLAAMLLMHWGRVRSSDPRLDIAKRRTMEERKETLERAIFLEVPNGQALSGQPLSFSAPSTVRRNSRFTDPDRLDHDLI